MSGIAVKPSCIACGKEVAILKCESCWKTGINLELVGQDKVKVQQHKLIQEVDDWECNAINRIRETAEEARRQILKHTTDRMSLVGGKLSKLSDQLQQHQQAGNFDPKTVSQCQAELAQLSQQMANPSSVTVRHVSTPLVTNIIVDIPGKNQTH
jgi:capsule polysaccharide export protein KpsE/RkpR